MIQHVANDVLTRVRNPKIGKDWHVPRMYVAGAKGEKNGQPYRIRRFIVCRDSVFMQVRFRGDRNYTSLFIGFRENFHEKIILS